jgi:phosphohistidine swiveling domain-containing protein
MNRSLTIANRNAAMQAMYETLGAAYETLEFREIGGWEYMTLRPLASIADIARRAAVAERVIASHWADHTIERWNLEWKPSYAARFERARGIDLGRLADDDLECEITRLITLLDDGVDTHFLLHGAILLPLARYVFAARDLLGWSDADAIGLLSGCSTFSIGASERLRGLARQAAARSGVLAILDDPTDADRLARLAREAPDFYATFDAFRWRDGCRMTSYDIADPTLAELPDALLDLVREIAHDGRRRDLASLTEGRKADPDHGAERRAKTPAALEDALGAAERAYGVREENSFYTISAPLALCRYALRELGRRMRDSEAVEDVDDVFFLEIAEALSWFANRGGRHRLVASRRAERAHVEATPGLPVYGAAAPPCFDMLPPTARFVNEAIAWNVLLTFEPYRTISKSGSTVLRGIAAAPGVRVGRVRVAESEQAATSLQAGEILVCPIASPVLAVFFPVASALVTDTGGLLSHAAIIAREHGIPAVVATISATRCLATGDYVEVNGNAGTVTLLSPRHDS